MTHLVQTTQETETPISILQVDTLQSDGVILDDGTFYPIPFEEWKRIRFNYEALVAAAKETAEMINQGDK